MIALPTVPLSVWVEGVSAGAEVPDRLTRGPSDISASTAVAPAGIRLLPPPPPPPLP